MLSHTPSLSEESWFTREGPDQDVVISTRCRLSRNLSGIPFPPAAGREEQIAVFKAIESALYEAKELFVTVDQGQADELERRCYRERNLLPPPRKGQHLEAAAFVREDEAAAVQVWDKDHVKIVSLVPGLATLQGYGMCDVIDSHLERYLDYAVSLRLGYLTSEIDNAGSGLRGSVMLHLPVLEHNGKLSEAMQEVDTSSVKLEAFPGSEHISKGSIYIISNRTGFGRGDEATLVLLEENARLLLHYERDARAELVGRHGDEIQDSAYRALGILRHSRSVGATEAYDLVSTVRLGVAAGLVDEVPIADVTALFVLLQEGHVRQAHRVHSEESNQTDALSKWRASAAREWLDERLGGMLNV
ncbi:MAG: hypothetical protein ACOC45_09385 [Alkalispirochaetaceae bacterium]